MTFTAGIHFTKSTIRVVILARSFRVQHSLKFDNRPKKWLELKSWFRENYPPGEIEILVAQDQYHSQRLPKILIKQGYSIRLVPKYLEKLDLFDIIGAAPKQKYYRTPFFRAALLTVPGFNERLIVLKRKKEQYNQLSLFD